MIILWREAVAWLIGVVCVGEVGRLWAACCCMCWCAWFVGFRLLYVWCPLGDPEECCWSCWRNWFGEHSSFVWNLTTVCLLWILWRYRNHHTFKFKGIEVLVAQLKSSCIRTLFELVLCLRAYQCWQCCWFHWFPFFLNVTPILLWLFWLYYVYVLYA